MSRPTTVWDLRSAYFAVSEADLQRQVLDFLRLRRIPATRNQAGHVRVGGSWLNLGTPGWPDIIACYRGRFLGIEVKRRGEQPGPLQLRAHEELVAAGAAILVVHSLAELEAGLKKLQTCATQPIDSSPSVH